jgi:hypothetical protein
MVLKKNGLPPNSSYTTIDYISFAGEDYYFARDDEELFGTWINLYYGTNPPQKLVYMEIIY